MATIKKSAKKVAKKRITIKKPVKNPVPIKQKLVDLYYLSVQEGGEWFRFWSPRKTLATAKKDAEIMSKKFNRPVKIEKARG